MPEWSAELKSFHRMRLQNGLSRLKSFWRAATCMHRADIVRAILTALVQPEKSDGLIALSEATCRER